MLLDGWILRLASGYTKRANSVTVLYRGQRQPVEKIRICQQVYAQANLPLIFRMSPLASAELDFILEHFGFAQLDFTSVQIKDLLHFNPTAVEHLQIWPQFSVEWLDRFAQICEMSIDEQQLLTAILTSILPKKAFAILWKGGEAVAGGFAVLEGLEVGLFEIHTAKKYRRQGYARSLINGLLSWARPQPATTAYLQVVMTNQPALQLYKALGFSEVYQYFYRVQTQELSL